MKPIGVELGTSRSGPAGAGSVAPIGAAFGGIVAAVAGRKARVRRIVIFGGLMVGAGLIFSSSGGLFALYAGHGVLMGPFGAACMFSPLITYVSRWFERRRGQQAVALISRARPPAHLAADPAAWRRLLWLALDHGRVRDPDGHRRGGAHRHLPAPAVGGIGHGSGRLGPPSIER